jgi:membrane protease YdiL (CAAX protease family)
MAACYPTLRLCAGSRERFISRPIGRLEETMKFSQEDSKKDITIGVLYAVLICALGAYLNYTRPYDANPVTLPSATSLLLWVLLYVPLGLFTAIADWKIKDFGFSINRRLGLALLPVLFLCVPIAWTSQVPWPSALIEAFARTGEEVFFRGFLFLLLLKIFSEKARPGMWAILVSALVFALIHTQTFQASFISGYGAGPIGYRILERMFNLFLIGALFALLRHWTQSILPGVIAHSLLNGGVFTLPFCLAIFAGVVFWAHKRGESVLSGINPNKSAT